MNKHNQGYNEAIEEVLAYLFGYFEYVKEFDETDKARILKSIEGFKFKDESEPIPTKDPIRVR